MQATNPPRQPITACSQSMHIQMQRCQPVSCSLTIRPVLKKKMSLRCFCFYRKTKQCILEYRSLLFIPNVCKKIQESVMSVASYNWSAKYLLLWSYTKIFPHVWVTTDGVWIGEWIYWPLTQTTQNYKQLRGSVDGWDTMLQAGRSWVRIPMRWIFFNLPNPSSRSIAVGSSASNRNEYQESSLGARGGRRKADKLTICLYRVLKEPIKPSSAKVTATLLKPENRKKAYTSATLFHAKHTRASRYLISWRHNSPQNKLKVTCK
jgi:hypothetical protein